MMRFRRSSSRNRKPVAKDQEHAPTRYDSSDESPRSVVASAASAGYDQIQRTSAFDEYRDGMVPPICEDGELYRADSNDYQSHSTNPFEEDFVSDRGRTRRAASVERPMQTHGLESSSQSSSQSSRQLKILGRAAAARRCKSTERPIGAHGSERVRSRSRGHSRGRDPVAVVGSVSHDSEYSDRKRKSKADKIKKLQTKNELYKEEYKKVQKDKKNLKKEMERSKDEVASLTKEIDAHIAETSVLKLKLSEALQELDRADATGHDSRKELAMVQKLSQELSQTKIELHGSVGRIARLNAEVEGLRESIQRKDEQIESLADEVSRQSESLQNLREENEKLKGQARKDPKQEEMISNLLEENERTQTELGRTLDRAASMVKEREDAIADLLKENDDMKRLLAIHEGSSSEESRTTHAALNQLKEELDTVARSLEEAQDRNVLLDEEVEAWIARGGEMENEIERLRIEVENWKEQTNVTKEAVVVVEQSALEAHNRAEAVQLALTESQTKHAEELSELESKYRAELLAAEQANTTVPTAPSLSPLPISKSRSGDSHSVCSSTDQEKMNAKDLQTQQDMLLQRAVASRQKKTSTDKQGTWGSVISGFMKQEEEEVLDENQKRIKELEAERDTRDEEIKKLKSEMVRLRSSYNETVYVNKKTIERLTSENEAYSLKATALQLELGEVKKGSLPITDVIEKEL